MPLQAAAERLEFTPPPEPRPLAAMGLALLAHLLLVGALGWGITWNKDREVTAEAEIWSANVQLAAPALVETPPPPPPAPAPPPPPAPIPVVAPPAPPPPQVKDAAIALEREKEQRRKQEEKERKAQDKAKKERAEKEAREAAEKKAAEKKAADKQAAERAEQKLAEKKAADKKAAEKAEKDRRTREEAEARRTAQLREENLKRMQGLAGATGAPTATGNALKSSGPSPSYAGRIQAKVKPNIVFTEEVPGNPEAEVEVRMASDGTITSRKITKSSGVKSWDDAVLRALDRTEVLPKDVDGRVISPLIITFKPK